MGENDSGNGPAVHGPGNESEGGAAKQSGGWRMWWVPVLALAVAFIGVVLILTSAPLGGWFGTAPLNTDFGFVAGQAVILNDQELAGWGVLGLGIAVFLFWAGYRVGRHKARNS